MRPTWRRNIWISGTVLSIFAVALMVVDLVSLNKVVGLLAVMALLLGSLLSITSRYTPSFRQNRSAK